MESKAIENKIYQIKHNFRKNIELWFGSTAFYKYILWFLI